MASQDLMSLIHQAGFTGDAANTMYGIVMAESGGNANAHNGNAGTGDNSYGLAQINMLGSMGEARLKQFGLAAYNDLYDPLTNLKVAYALSDGGRNFTPWTTFTSGAYRNAAPGAVVSNDSANGNAILSSANTSGGGAATSTSGGGGATATLTPAQQKAALIQGAGPLGALLTSVPELNGLLNTAVSSGWTAAEFQNKITNSQWYRAHSDAARQAMVLAVSDPATYTQQLHQAGQKVSNLMAQMGISTVGMTNSQYVSLAKQVQMGTITDQELQKQLAQFFGAGTGQFGQNYKEGQATGQAANYDSQLRQIYAQYGQTVQPGQIAYRVRQLLSGGADIKQYEEQAKVNAKAMFPGMAQQIDSGMTVKDLAQPYIQSMSNLLELDPNSINLNDRSIRAAMQGTGATVKGQPPTATPLWQFEQQMRQDPRWQSTVNAHNDTAGVLTALGKEWGMTS
jgi:hypothetical protein